MITYLHFVNPNNPLISCKIKFKCHTPTCWLHSQIWNWILKAVKFTLILKNSSTDFNLFNFLIEQGIYGNSIERKLFKLCKLYLVIKLIQLSCWCLLFNKFFLRSPLYSIVNNLMYRIAREIKEEINRWSFNLIFRFLNWGQVRKMCDCFWFYF